MCPSLLLGERLVQLRTELETRLCEQRRPSGDDPVTGDHRVDAEAAPAREAARRAAAPLRRHARAATACATGCSLAASAAPASRSTSPRSAPFGGTTRVDPHPSLGHACPSCRARSSSTRRVRSSTSGPLIEDAELRAAAGADHQRGRRREAERARAGDDQHRDGGGEARRRRRRSAGATRRASRARSRSRPARRRRRRGRRDAAPAPCPPAPRSTSRAICASAVSAPTLVARTTSRPYVLIVAPGDLGAGADLDGHGLTGQQRLVDGRLAVDDDAVGRDLLARTHDEAVPDRRAPRPGRASPSPSRSTRASFAPSSRSARIASPARRRARASKNAAEQDQRRDRRRRPRSRCRRRAPASETTTDQVQAASVPSEISVSIVGGAVPRVDERGAVERPAGPEARPASASASATHSQPSNWSGGTIASSTSGTVSTAATSSRRADAIRRRARSGVSSGSSERVVAGRLDRARARSSTATDGRVEGDGGLLGGEVDGGLDAVELVQPASRSGRRTRRTSCPRARGAPTRSVVSPPRSQRALYPIRVYEVPIWRGLVPGRRSPRRAFARPRQATITTSVATPRRPPEIVNVSAARRLNGTNRPSTRASSSSCCRQNP